MQFETILRKFNTKNTSGHVIINVTYKNVERGNFMELNKEYQASLTNEFGYAWDKVNDEEKKEVFSFSKDYMNFLDTGKTERESAREILRLAKEQGFVDINELIKSGKKINAGDKVYAMNRDKAIILFVIGEENISTGMNIVGAHIDAPRIDVKPVPLFEDCSVSYMKTHYYGGIKKYQWVAQPLALHGVVRTKKGVVDIVIGEDDQDPVVYITDILPHLAKDQYAKKIGEGITGEELNVIMGSIPVGDDKLKDRSKLHVLHLLNEKYGITEKDFVAAELEIVPAGKARDVGLDRGMIAAYGHDDRVCSYAGVRAIFDVEKCTKTAVGMFMDKEEVGSQGNTGSESRYFENMVAELINLQETYSDLLIRRSLSNTKVLSADVGAAYDPKFAGAYEKQNSGFAGKGVQIVKYTGSRGKGGCNDANAEFVGEVMEIFEENNVVWQTGELGKVDQGGGGTIAYILANADAEVVDCGVPVLSMHAPYELISKIDLFMAYKGYAAFLNR